MKRAAEITAVALVFAGFGCESGSRSLVDDYRHEYAVAVCDMWFACPTTDADDAIDRLAVETPAECVRLLEANSDLSILEQQLENGTVRIDQDALRECVANVRELCVASFSVWPCDDIVVGTVGLNGACRFDSDCASENCSATSSSCGACVLGANAGIGGGCTDSSNCARSSEGPVDCVVPEGSSQGTCQLVPAARLVGPGQECGIGAAADGADLHCGANHYCDPSTGTCAAELPLGAPCEIDFDACVKDAACAEDQNGDAACRAVVVHDFEGEYCNLDAPTPELCDTREHLACDEASNHCYEYGDGSLGKACFADENCDPGLYCRVSTGTGVCLELLALGETCTRSDECASRYCYGGQTKTCTDLANLLCE